MHWYNYVALVGSAIGAFGLASQRRWLLAAAFACLAAYQLFDKAMPTVLPEALTIVFPLAGLLLAILDIAGMRKRGKLYSSNRAI